MLNRILLALSLSIFTVSAAVADGSSQTQRAEQLRYMRRARIGAKALADVCPNTRDLFRGEIWKSIASRHITDIRAKSTSFITTRSTTPPALKCVKVYDKDGNQVHKLGRYYPNGAAYSARLYGGARCGDKKRAKAVAALAVANTGSPEVYLKVSNSMCVKVPNANKCYNSSGC